MAASKTAPRRICLADGSSESRSRGTLSRQGTSAYHRLLRRRRLRGTPRRRSGAGKGRLRWSLAQGNSQIARNDGASVRQRSLEPCRVAAPACEPCCCHGIREISQRGTTSDRLRGCCDAGRLVTRRTGSECVEFGSAGNQLKAAQG